MRCAPVRYERCCSQQRRSPVSNGSRLTTATAEPLDGSTASIAATDATVERVMANVAKIVKSGA
jgi:hypothetical protein